MTTVRARCAVPVAVIGVMLLAAVSAPWWAASPDALHVSARLEPPSRAHPFGTDNFGRDLFARVIVGARVSLGIGIAVAAISGAAGALTGVLAGYYRRVDAVLMRAVDGVLAFPALLLALAIVATLGAGALNEVLALCVVFWPRTARIVRASTLQLREAPFVEAAVALGAGDRRILVDHILRNALGPLIVQTTFVYAEAVIADAALSFLGLGVKPPTPTWGNILGDARSYLIVAPWYATFAGLAIVSAALAFNALGETLRVALDAGGGRGAS